MLWNRFETNLANINEDVIIEDALSIDMALESGDTGIEDTLREYFAREYKYIQQLPQYLKQWVRTIKIRDTARITSSIADHKNDYYVNFNYTSVLERVYGIRQTNVLHIHDSLHDFSDDPIIGHGNIDRINSIEEQLESAELDFDEKKISICSVIREYYKNT